eukprot:gene36387-44884_t
MTCRPGGGPARPGVRAPRHNELLQEAFYNGWKKFHGIKYQSLELPNGMCADLYGPKSFRASDLELLVESDLNARLAEVQQDWIDFFKAYGDGIYPIQSHMIE